MPIPFDNDMFTESSVAEQPEIQTTESESFGGSEKKSVLV